MDTHTNENVKKIRKERVKIFVNVRERFLDRITKFVYNFVIKKEVLNMPVIKSSADLRNNYNEISTFCHTYTEPVFITKNGKGDLAVMSIEAYEEMNNRFELYGLIKEGLDDIAGGICVKNPTVADDLLDEAEKQINSLSDFPEKFECVNKSL
jgi:PHD/YefM family antitoxin component YafN of YafNO toxin-antitoxin module